MLAITFNVPLVIAGLIMLANNGLGGYGAYDRKGFGLGVQLAMAEWQSTLDKKVTEVGVEIISEVVSMMTGIPLTKISTQESKRLMNLDKELMGKVIGQDEAVTKVIKAIKRNRIGIKDKNKPVGSFIFLGPTGVGKTLLAKFLAEQVYGDPESLIRIDMSEYMEKHSVSRLVGPPPGYVGYDQGGQLTQLIYMNYLMRVSKLLYHLVKTLQET